MDKTFSSCFLCPVVDEYVNLANSFTQDLSKVLLEPMWLIFLSIVGLWIVIHGLKIAFGKGDLIGLLQEFVFVSVAAGLLHGQGPELVNLIFRMALSTMSGAASVVLNAGSAIGTATGITAAAGGSGPASAIENLAGMHGLVATAEGSVRKLFDMGGEMMAASTLTDWSPFFYAVILMAPYLILLIVYFAEVVLAIFRVVMIASLSPILMLALGFGWGRDIVVNGLRTIFASFMVLFGATVALAICLYAVQKLGVGDPKTTGVNVREFMSLTNGKLLVAIAMGWLGTAFQMEATGIANSIARSQLTNTAAGIITAGMSMTGLAALNRIKDQWGDSASNAGGAAASGAAKGAGWLAGAGLAGLDKASGGRLSPMAQAVMDRIKNPTGKKD